jgi:hypothetical protein
MEEPPMSEVVTDRAPEPAEPDPATPEPAAPAVEQASPAEQEPPAPPVDPPAASLTPRPRWHDRVCPCGVKFTPTGPRQMFHNTDDCPAYIEHKEKMKGNGGNAGNGVAMKVPTQRRDRKKVAKASKPRPTRTPKREAPRAPEEPLLTRLIADCDRDLEQVEQEAGPLEAQAAELAERIAKLQAQHKEIMRIKAALKSAT